MELEQALTVLMQLVAQMTLNVKGQDIPTVNAALTTVQEHLNRQSAESSITPPEVLVADEVA